MSYLDPALPLLLLIGFAGLVRVYRAKQVPRWASRFLLASLLGLLLFSTNLFAVLFAFPLEGWYDKDNPVPQGEAEAIVILSGYVSPALPNRPYSYVGYDTYVRLQHGLWLYRNWKALPILVTGGSFDEHPPHAEAMRRVLETEGIPADQIWTEGRSQSTHENAAYSTEILKERGITRVALVVEASSMLRASRSFEKAGLTVVPAPFRFAQLTWEITDVVPDWRAVSLNAETVHELGGLVWYWMRGRI
jgi:uncharacterized SAM-binding protein YcdF (DUF218 family)